MALSFAGKCGMFMLVAINVLFLCSGVSLMVVGILMEGDNDVIERSEVVKTLNEVNFNENLSLGNVFSSLRIFVIVFGGFMVMVAFLGCCSACCKDRRLLVAYAMIVILVLVAQIVVVALCFTMKDRVENKVKGELETALTKYEGPTSTSEVSIGWDLIFMGFYCCGVEDVGTSNRLEFQNSAWYTNRGTKEIPFSCCFGATRDNYKYGVDRSCTDGNYTAVKSNGCYDAFKERLLRNLEQNILNGMYIIVLEILMVVFSFIIFRDIGKSDMVV